jgi:hypothetical protein
MEWIANIVPIIGLLVTVDLWAGATGDGDPFLVWHTDTGKAFSFMAAARGIGLVLATWVVLRAFRIVIKRTAKADRRIAIALVCAAGALLCIEAIAISPYVYIGSLQSAHAMALLKFSVFDFPLGAVLYALWSVVVATAMLVAVAASAFAGVIGDALSMAHPTRTGTQDGAEEKPSTFLCARCGVEFPKQQGLAAHIRHAHRNGHAEQVAELPIVAQGEWRGNVS